MTPMPTSSTEDLLTTDRHEAMLGPKNKIYDVYFSADVETDGPIPGPFSMLSFALVYAGAFDGSRFIKPSNYDLRFYAEIRPISENFDPEALRVNRMDREKLLREGQLPEAAMKAAMGWVQQIAGEGKPVLVAYPLSFDWSWLYWYFILFLLRISF